MSPLGSSVRGASLRSVLMHRAPSQDLAGLRPWWAGAHPMRLGREVIFFMRILCRPTITSSHRTGATRSAPLSPCGRGAGGEGAGLVARFLHDHCRPRWARAHPMRASLCSPLPLWEAKVGVCRLPVAVDARLSPSGAKAGRGRGGRTRGEVSPPLPNPSPTRGEGLKSDTLRTDFAGALPASLTLSHPRAQMPGDRTP